jgi:uncharacterized membrane protein YuzA (DUF378 family)
MRWLASRPRWLLVGTFVLLLLTVLFGWVRSIDLVSGVAIVLLFVLFFATLMALVVRRETPRPPSRH